MLAPPVSAIVAGAHALRGLRHALPDDRDRLRHDDREGRPLLGGRPLRHLLLCRRQRRRVPARPRLGRRRLAGLRRHGGRHVRRSWRRSRRSPIGARPPNLIHRPQSKSPRGNHDHAEQGPVRIPAIDRHADRVQPDRDRGAGAPRLRLHGQAPALPVSRPAADRRLRQDRDRSRPRTPSRSARPATCRSGSTISTMWRTRRSPAS